MNYESSSSMSSVAPHRRYSDATSDDESVVQPYYPQQQEQPSNGDNSSDEEEVVHHHAPITSAYSSDESSRESTPFNSRVVNSHNQPGHDTDDSVEEEPYRQRNLPPQSNYQEENDEDDGDSDEEMNHAIPPLQPRDDSSSSSSSGSELETPQKATPTVTKKKRKVTPKKSPLNKKASANKRKKEESSKDSKKSSSVKKKIGKKKSLTSKKTKGTKKVKEEEEEEDDDVMAAVVINEDASDDISDTEVVAVAVAEPIEVEPEKKTPRKKVSKTKPKANTTSKKGKKKVTKKKPGKKKKKALDDVDLLSPESAIPHEKMEAAGRARDMLLHSIQRLPIEITESHTVRNLGRIKIEDKAESLFSNSNALYPVGFSCDRYEFSPVHGRPIKLRCDILDSRQMKHDANQQKKEGPLFRITWGKGVDEYSGDRSFPFDLYSSAAPVGDNVDAVAVPLGVEAVAIAPEPGMRVKVRFDQENWYGGTIIKVTKNSHEKDASSTNKKTGKKKQFSIKIQYDDGAKEETCFPDPDILLLPPGSEETGEGCTLDIKMLKGKSVKSVIGTSPIEAWGKLLIEFGLIDEIMLESSMEALEDARKESLADIRERVDGKQKQRQKDKEKHKPIIVRVRNGVAVDFDKIFKNEEYSESLSLSHIDNPDERERALEERVKDLINQYEDRHKKSLQIASELAEARTSMIGSFLANPLPNNESSLNQQSAWLATVVRKEKAKMGSTGNKRKVVTATDLVERNSTFFNHDIECLVEGLPGSEFCSTYIFNEFRSGGVNGNASGNNHAWLQEVQARQEKEKQKKAKIAKENKLKASQQREKELKRKAREDERENRKKQKLEEAEEKKKAREEERLSRLSTQVGERLFKEACFQREKVILAAAKFLGKEFIRRRKAAETLSTHNVERTKLEPFHGKYRNIVNVLFEEKLPPLSKLYDVDVLRIWDFLSSYNDAFKEMHSLSKLPSLDELQVAMNCIKSNDCTVAERNTAIDLLINLAVLLCKPLASGLIKTLSSVLNTALQEKESIVENGANLNEKSVNDSDEDTFPINNYTWVEVARLVLMNDALNEIGLSKSEAAHVLRGYRSGGHPNSKEAQRLRRGEDSALAMRWQSIKENTPFYTKNQEQVHKNLRVRVNVPSMSKVTPTDWTFFLHNIKGLQSNAASAMKANIKKAQALLKNPTNKLSSRKIESYTAELERSVSFLEDIGTSYKSQTETQYACNQARKIALKILDKATDVNFSPNTATGSSDRALPPVKSLQNAESQSRVGKGGRLLAGIANEFILTSEQYKKSTSSRESYMETAIKLKEDLERKKKRDAGEDDEDEEDEEDDDDDDDDDDVDDDENKNGNPKEESEEDKKEDLDTTTESKPEGTVANSEKIGKETPHDEFCGDVPSAPELIRRCLAVLRSVCMSASSQPFLYPVDPQTNGKYYETILHPISLYDIGQFLQKAAKEHSTVTKLDEDECIPAKMKTDTEIIEKIVAEFARKMRRIAHNCSCYANVGSPIISSSEEMMRIFERLFLDWVLAPESVLPPLDMLDDDRCVEHHSTDEDCMVLFCDGCEGKFNMTRLDPPLTEVPKGDWYCPRCLSRRSWESLDPRIGLEVNKLIDEKGDGSINQDDSKEFEKGIIKGCRSKFSEEGNTSSTLMYVIRYDNGEEELWSLTEVDKSLKKDGKNIAPIRCLEAVAESPGYGSGPDRGKYTSFLPVPLNPLVSDTAAQATVNSSVYQDTILTCCNLSLINPHDFKAYEWQRLLILLMMKCTSSDKIQEVASKLENDAQDKFSKDSIEILKIKSINEILPKVSDDEDDFDSDEEELEMKDDPETIESLDQTSRRKVNNKSVDSPKEDHSDEEEWDDNTLERGDQNVREKESNVASQTNQIETEVPASNSSSNANISNEPSVSIENVGAKIDNEPEKVLSGNGDVISSAESKKKTQRLNALTSKSSRQKEREDCFAAYCIKNQMASTIASFDEDNLTDVINNVLISKVEGLSLAASRCRGDVCCFCGLSDITLGTTLVRVPSEMQWSEMMVHANCSRKLFLTAQIDVEDIAKKQNSAENKNENEEKKSSKKLLAVSVRLEGQLFSTKIEDSEYYDEIPDFGMVQFLPNNPAGFQYELLCHHNDNLPFVTGSSIAHECCAIASHKARKDKMMQDFKDKRSQELEVESGNTCGRTLCYGFDKSGRSYWKFPSDPRSLFILAGTTNNNLSETQSEKVFHRFCEPEAIASIMVCLGKEKVFDELRRAFPEAYSLIPNRKWSDILQKRMLKLGDVVKTNLGDISIEPKSVSTERAAGSKSGDGKGNEESNEEEFDVSIKTYFSACFGGGFFINMCTFPKYVSALSSRRRCSCRISRWGIIMGCYD